MSELAARLASVLERMARAARRAGRDPSDVRLVAISKTFPASRIAEAQACGQRVFGENRVQEAATKLAELDPALRKQGEWHLVGSLQRNKARRAVELFDVIHSVDRPALAVALAAAASRLEVRPRVLLQIDLDDEPQKGGVPPEGAASLLAEIDAAGALEPVGLMAIPRPRPDPEQMRPAFARLRQLREALNAERGGAEPLRELSMGMSADFEVAIEEGATWVRIGTAIFGERGHA